MTLQPQWIKKEAFAFNKNLTPEQERELAAKFQNGDPKAYLKLKKSLQGIIRTAVRDAHRNNPSMDEHLLVTRANAELPKIIKKYNASHDSGAKLSSWVMTQLRHLLMNATHEYEEGSHVSRAYRQDLNRLQTAKANAQMEFNKDQPQNHELLKFLPDNWDDEKLENIKKYDRLNRIGDIDHSGDEDDPVYFKDQFIQDTTYGEGDDISEMNISRMERLMRDKLTDDERKIVEMVNVQGQPKIKVAMSLGTTSPRIKKVLEKWKNILEQEGIFDE